MRVRAGGGGVSDDATRPVPVGALPESAPILRMAVAQAALAALIVHLVSAGGVSSAPAPVPPPLVAPTPVPTPAPTPSPLAPSPGVSVAARRVLRPPAPRPTPVPTPLPAAGPVLPPADAPLVAPAPTRPRVDAARVYDEDEVDVKPRRIAGTTGTYPEWGPRLPKGKSVSITASYVVTEEGLVTDIRVERGGGVLEAVLPEISQWKYEPGTKDGVPVKVRVRMKHTFIGF